jgi:hypothetical protein
VALKKYPVLMGFTCTLANKVACDDRAAQHRRLQTGAKFACHCLAKEERKKMTREHEK